jgi:hypothetical protein
MKLGIWNDFCMITLTQFGFAVLTDVSTKTANHVIFACKNKGYIFKSAKLYLESSAGGWFLRCCL